MTIIAGVLSFIFSGRLNGVREGTVIAALLVGFIARLFGKKLDFVKTYLFPEEYRNEAQTSGKSKAEENAAHKNVIVIGRQYGCGGHDIGKALAEKLGYEFYDQEIIKMIAGTTGMTSEFIRRKEETMTNSLLYDFVNQMYLYGNRAEEAPKDKIFEAESNVIRDLAKKGNCIIIGRCSDYVLREDKNVLKIFLSAPLETRIKRIMQKLNVTSKEAEQQIRKEDKRRADNYCYYTGRMWGMSASFDLALNTELGMEYIEECVQKAL